MKNNTFLHFENLFSTKHKKQFKKIFNDSNIFDLFFSVDNEFFIKGNNDNKSLMVTSATHGEGKTTISILLSCLAAFSDPDSKVLLVDTNFNNDDIFKYMNLESEQAGLMEILSGKTLFEDCIQRTGLRNLDVLVSKKPGTPASVFMIRQFEQFISEIRSQYNYIIVDTTANVHNKYSPSLAKTLENVLLVIAFGEAKREQVEVLINDINESQADIMGAIINKRRFVLPKLFYV